MIRWWCFHCFGLCFGVRRTLRQGEKVVFNHIGREFFRKMHGEGPFVIKGLDWVPCGKHIPEGHLLKITTKEGTYWFHEIYFEKTDNLPSLSILDVAFFLPVCPALFFSLHQ
jgi:hypothetical protein